MTLKHRALNAIGAIGLLWYYLCIIGIGFGFANGPEMVDFRSFMSLSITTIGVSLATFVGMLLGFRGVSGEIQAGMPPAQVEAETEPLRRIADGTSGSRMQWVAALLYVLSLLLALFCWWRGGAEADPAIVNLGKSLLGVIAGALSVLLNLPK